MLNDYTNAFTASETPFASWITIVKRRYSALPNPQTFFATKTFLNIWFAYVKILQFGNDMVCPQCGPNPSAIIWDGVSISFAKEKTLPTLCPPTTIKPASAVYEDTVRVKGTQCIADRGLRRRIRDILNGPPLDASNLVVEEHEDSGSDSVCFSLACLSLIGMSELGFLFAWSFALSTRRRSSLDPKLRSTIMTLEWLPPEE